MNTQFWSENLKGRVSKEDNIKLDILENGHKSINSIQMVWHDDETSCSMTARNFFIS
jgi:hypothetical protein